MTLHVDGRILSLAEPILLAMTWCAFMRRKAHRDFPAFGVYVSVRLAIYAALNAILYVAHLSLVDKHLGYALYYYIFWVGYLAGAGTALLVTLEIFQHLMRSLPNLGRYGLMAFRWVTVTSIVISLAMALYPTGQKRDLLISATGAVMRCMSVLELCLLAFVLVSLQTLRLSPRSWEFGIALGLAAIASADLFGSAFAFSNPTLASLANYCSDIVVTLAPTIWLLYFLRPQVEAKLIGLPASARLQRWEEVVRALGQPTPQPSPSLGLLGDSFLEDVERVVDRVLEKNRPNPVQ